MESRMKNPAFVVPDVFPALQAVGAALKKTNLPPLTRHLVHLRASQINGCGFCVDMHSRELKADGDTEQRIFSVGAWREAPWFTAAERAALALTEAATRIADKSDAVPDDVWNEAARHYDEATLAALVMDIAMINFWNRINVPIKQPAGARY